MASSITAANLPYRTEHTGEPSRKKTKRRRPNTACAECRKSHFKCEGIPPCQQCTRKGVKCYFPVGSNEKIKLLEEAVLNLTSEVECNKSQALIYDYRLHFMLSWKDTCNTQFIPALNQTFYSQKYLRMSRAFQTLVSLTREFISNPLHEAVLLRQIQDLEVAIIGDQSEVVACFVRSLLLYQHLAELFFNARMMKLAKSYSDKINKATFDNVILIPKVDNELVKSCLQLAATIKQHFYENEHTHKPEQETENEDTSRICLKRKRLDFGTSTTTEHITPQSSI